MKTLDILERLVSFDTDVDHSSLEAVEFVANFLQDRKAKVSLISKDYKGVHDSNRASLIASFGNIEKPGIIFSGHLDTTKIPNQEHLWLYDPLKLTVVDGKAYGKGCTDMKGAIAAFLAQAEKLKFFSKNIPIHLILTHDEEGVFTAINQLKEHSFYNIIPLRQKGCVVMEPSSLRAVSAHRGNKRISVDITGYPAHGSIPDQGVDAVYYTFQIYKYAQKLAKKSFNHIDERFEYPKTALNISNFHAGISDSMIPDKSHFDLSCRYVPNENINDFFSNLYLYINFVSERMKKKHQDCKIIITERNHVLPLNANENCEFVKLVKQASGCRSLESVTYGSEAGYFQSMEIDTVIYGPGNILCAHKPNEFVSISDLTRFEHFFENINYVNLQNRREVQRDG